MATPAFKTKKGDLTAYALACGYIEKVEIGDDIIVLQALDCPNVYLVSLWEGKYNSHDKDYRLLTDARREFKKLVSMKKRADTLRTGTFSTTFPPLAAV
jgi:hypothetical protein